MTSVEVAMPQMGVSVAEGTVTEWKKRVGDWVESDETIVEISTDKIETEVPSPATGRVSEILVEVGQTVDVGTLLARIETDARPGEPHADEHTGDRPQAGAPVADSAGAEAGPVGPTVDGGVDGTPESAEPGYGRPKRRGGPPTSPVVRRMADEHDLDLSQIEGSGRRGRVTKRDVLAYLGGRGDGPETAPTTPTEAKPEPAATPDEATLHTESPYREDPAPVTRRRDPATPLSIMRRKIGEHMKRSLETAATCTTWMEVDMSRIERARREQGLTALAYVARCTVEALREMPTLNAHMNGDDFTVHEDVNLGIAVSLGDDGLIVPVIQRAQELSAEGIGARLKDLARRARSRELAPEDVQGATFTITNPGQYGTIMATPIINQPQVAILDLEAIVKRPVVVTDEEGSDSIAIRPMCILGLSWDHRALDGALAAQFLAAVKRRVEGWSG